MKVATVFVSLDLSPGDAQQLHSICHVICWGAFQSRCMTMAFCHLPRASRKVLAILTT